VARIPGGTRLDSEMKLSERRAFLRRVSFSVVYVQHGSADHAIIRARQKKHRKSDDV
jgi:hypothetical protein